MNRRKYIRVSTVIPVEFYLQDSNSKRLTPWIQGFTSDLSQGGICLWVNDLWPGFVQRLNNRDVELLIKINLPFKKENPVIHTKTAWMTQEKTSQFNRLIIGLEFVGAEPKYTWGLFKFALIKRLVPRLAAIIIFSLAAIALSLQISSFKLIQENRKLVFDYVQVLEKRSLLEKSLKQEQTNRQSLLDQQMSLQKKIDQLQKDLNDSQVQYQEVIKRQKQAQDLITQQAKQTESEFILGQNQIQQISAQKKDLEKNIAWVNQQLEVLKRENEFLKSKQQQAQKQVSLVQDQVNNLDKQTIPLGQHVISGMHQWIKNRQDLIRGLVLSYEGDRELNRVSFTYDQALAVIAFLLADDQSSAKKVLDFYLDQVQKNKEIFNSYYVNGNVAESVVHCGPNAWIGLAALQYVEKTGDKKYLAVAQKAAQTLFSQMDQEGGIKGGPSVTWYSTEHNLDASAFFDLYYRLTGQKKYEQAAKKVRQWISKYAYTSTGSLVNRGKGDSTIATDTYAWSITAIGPNQLNDMNMNPDSILEFAVENCQVTTDFWRKQGQISIQGFDFARSRNLSRGGVVSGEWTAQMILAFEIMADHYRSLDQKKYQDYLEKARFYYSQLQRMIITSLSKAGREDPCLPYASKPSVDTGHGWRAPNGDRTGSLSSTAYFLIAYYGYNPLTGTYLNLDLKDQEN